MSIKERLQEVFRDVFDDEEIVLFDTMTAEDIEDWDSLMHISLIKQIEDEFEVEFTTEEILNTKNVGMFIKLVEDKM